MEAIISFSFPACSEWQCAPCSLHTLPPASTKSLLGSCLESKSLFLRFYQASSGQWRCLQISTAEHAQIREFVYSTQLVRH